MRKATSLLTLVGMLLVAGLVPTAALSQIQLEPIVGIHTGAQATVVEVGGEGLNPGVPNAFSIAYDNTASAANFGISSTDLASIWGDELNLTTTGVLSTHVFTVFNTGTSAGPLLSAIVLLEFFDAATDNFLGSYQANVGFGAGLPPGFFSLVTVPGLDGLNIVFPSTGVVVQQRLASVTGPANRLGVASMNPPTIGTSPDYMLIASSTIAGGVPGFYIVNSLPSNPGYQIGVEQTPTGTVAQTWGRMKALYR